MYLNIIKEICNELNIKYTLLSKDWIIKLEYNNKIKYLAQNKFDLNGHVVGIILDDKYAFYSILKDLNINTCIHKIFYSPNNKTEIAKNCHTYEDIYNYFKECNNDIVIKPNNGSEGVNVYHITNKEDIKNIVDNLFINNYSISICPYYHIKNEYRVIILNNEVKLIFKKIRPIIYGDGIHTINELLNIFNPYYFKNINVSNKILNKDEEYIYDWKFNLSRGSICTINIESNIKNKVESLAKEVSTKVGITFSSIDIVELENNELLVLEANSGTTINKCINFIPNGYNIAKDIYKEAIINLFER